MDYRQKWSHALSDDENFKDFLHEHLRNIDKELSVLVDITKGVEAREVTLLSETKDLEKEIVDIIGKLSSYDSHEVNKKVKLFNAAIEKSAKERREVMLKGESAKAIQMIKRERALEKQLADLREKSIGAFKVEPGTAEHVEGRIRELFRHYVVLFHFFEEAIKRINADFEMEMKSAIQYTLREQQMISHANINLKLLGLAKMRERIMKRRAAQEAGKIILQVEEDYKTYYKDLEEFINELKKLKLAFEAKLDRLDKEFSELKKKAAGVAAELEWHREEDLRLAAKLGIPISDEMRAMRIKTIDYVKEPYFLFVHRRQFLNNVRIVLEWEAVSVSKNEKKLLSILHNIYYRLLEQRQLSKLVA